MYHNIKKKIFKVNKYYREREGGKNTNAYLPKKCYEITMILLRVL